MVLALRPARFACGIKAPDGSAWDVFGELYEENPKLTVDEGGEEMLQVFMLYRSGGLAGHGPLPEAGGTAEQALLNLEALAVMSDAAAELDKENRPRPGPAKTPRARRRR